MKSSELRWIVLGAWGLCLVAATYRVATNLTFSDAYYMEPTLPLWLRRTVSALHDGSFAVAAVALVLALGSRRLAPSRQRINDLASTLLACGGLIALWFLGGSALEAYAAREYDAPAHARFDAWRTLIAPQATVFWGDSPAAAWLLLERANYLSLAQTSGVVFSRAAALEMQRRATRLEPPIATRAFMSWKAGKGDLLLSRGQLEELCRIHAFDFLVTTAPLDIPALAQAQRDPNDAVHVTRLYGCVDQARAAAAST